MINLCKKLELQQSDTFITIKSSITRLLIYIILSMLDLNLASLQTDMGVILERFAKIYEKVQTKVEEGGLGKKTLGIN